MGWFGWKTHYFLVDTQVGLSRVYTFKSQMDWLDWLPCFTGMELTKYSGRKWKNTSFSQTHRRCFVSRMQLLRAFGQVIFKASQQVRTLIALFPLSRGFSNTHHCTYWSHEVHNTYCFSHDVFQFRIRTISNALNVHRQIIFLHVWLY